MAHILSQKAFWMVNKQASKSLGSPLKALLLSDIISRYEYFEERNMLDKEGYFFCSYEDIANDLCISDSTVRKYLKDLIEKGLIKSKKVAGVPPRWFYCIINEEIDKIIKNSTKKDVQNESVNIPICNGEYTDMNRQMYRHNNNNKEIIINNKNKESECTRSNDLNSIQEKAGNKSYDPSETTLTADVKNKYTNLDAESKKELWAELRKTIWNYATSKNWIDDNYPKRWEILELQIKDFCGHHIDKGSFESQFFNYERKLMQWIDKDVLRESSIPYSIWNKTKEDLKGKLKADSNSDLPGYYDEHLYNSLSGDQLTAYKKKLYKEGYRYDRVKQCWNDRNGRVANGRRLKTKVTSNPQTQHEEDMSKIAKESISQLNGMFEEMGNKMNVNKK